MITINKKKIGQNFRLIRLHYLNKKIAEVAKEIGVTRQTLGAFELGQGKYFNMEIADKYEAYLLTTNFFNDFDIEFNDLLKYKLKEGIFDPDFNEYLFEDFNDDSILKSTTDKDIAVKKQDILSNLTADEALNIAITKIIGIELSTNIKEEIRICIKSKILEEKNRLKLTETLERLARSGSEPKENRDSESDHERKHTA